MIVEIGSHRIRPYTNTCWQIDRKARNKETYDAIMATHDVGRFNSLVGMFYREIGVKNPAGGSGTPAAPDISAKSPFADPAGG